MHLGFWETPNDQIPTKNILGVIITAFNISTSLEYLVSTFDKPYFVFKPKTCFSILSIAYYTNIYIFT